jgi:hypothetical protein
MRLLSSHQALLTAIQPCDECHRLLGGALGEEAVQRSAFHSIGST